MMRALRGLSPQTYCDRLIQGTRLLDVVRIDRETTRLPTHGKRWNCFDLNGMRKGWCDARGTVRTLSITSRDNFVQSD